MAKIGILFLFLSSLINEGRERLTSAIFFIGAMHYILSMYVFEFIGFYYYLSSAAACFLAILFIINQKITNLSIDLSRIFLAGMAINLLGWVLYESYVEPWYYNALFGIFYIVLIARLLIRNGRDGMGNYITHHGWLRSVLSVHLHSTQKGKSGRI